MGRLYSTYSPEELAVVREKKRAYNKAYRLKNRDRILAKQRERAAKTKEQHREESRRYYWEHHDVCLRKNRENYAKNKDKRLAYARAYSRRNRDRRLAYAREYNRLHEHEVRLRRHLRYVENREKICDAAKKYRLENSEKVRRSKQLYNASPAGRQSRRAACVRRRVFKALNRRTGSDKGIHWSSLAEKQGSMKCAICGIICEANKTRRGSRYPTVDHIIPISKGGTDTWDNVQLVCRGCNARKKDKLDFQAC